MAEFTSISAALSYLQSAGEIAKRLIKLRDTSMVQSKVIELQGEILSAQNSAIAAQNDQFALLTQVRSLEEEISNLKAWNAEKENYQLTEVATGAFAYTLKPEMQSTKPNHHLCAACFDHGAKSILQQIERYPGRSRVLICNNCGAEIYISGVWRPEHDKAQKKAKNCDFNDR